MTDGPKKTAGSAPRSDTRPEIGPATTAALGTAPEVAGSAPSGATDGTGEVTPGDFDPDRFGIVALPDDFVSELRREGLPRVPTADFTRGAKEREELLRAAAGRSRDPVAPGPDTSGPVTSAPGDRAALQAKRRRLAVVLCCGLGLACAVLIGAWLREPSDPTYSAVPEIDRDVAATEAEQPASPVDTSVPENSVPEESELDTSTPDTPAPEDSAAALGTPPGEATPEPPRPSSGPAPAGEASLSAKPPDAGAQSSESPDPNPPRPEPRNPGARNPGSASPTPPSPGSESTASRTRWFGAK